MDQILFIFKVSFTYILAKHNRVVIPNITQIKRNRYLIIFQTAYHRQIDHFSVRLSSCRRRRRTETRRHQRRSSLYHQGMLHTPAVLHRMLDSKCFHCSYFSFCTCPGYILRKKFAKYGPRLCEITSDRKITDLVSEDVFNSETTPQSFGKNLFSPSK